MKKLVMTGMVLAMACGAQAATIYEKGDTKVDMKGDVQIQLRQKVGKNKDMYMDYDDLTVGFYAKHKNEMGITAFSHLKMDWKKQASGSAAGAVDEASVGVMYGPVKLHIGRIDWGSDSFYIDEAVEIGHDVIATPDVGGYETIQGVIDLTVAELVLSADLAVTEGDIDNSGVAEAFLVSNPDALAGLEIGVLYQSYQPETIAATTNSAAMKPNTVDTVGVRAKYSIAGVTVGADYTTNDDVDIMNGVVKVKLPASSSVAVGYSMESPNAGDDVGTWYANVQHKLNKYSKVFAEVGGNDEQGTDMGYVAGMQVKF
jgi:predicted porin